MKMAKIWLCEDGIMTYNDIEAAELKGNEIYIDDYFKPIYEILMKENHLKTRECDEILFVIPVAEYNSRVLKLSNDLRSKKVTSKKMNDFIFFYF